MNKNIIISLVICFAFIGSYLNTSALTQQEIEQQIQALLTQIRLLQQQIAQLQAQKICPFVTTGLSKGYFEESNQEVKELQKLLKQDRSIYPEGLVTGYFGRLTEAALKRFQARYGLNQTGIVDEATKQKLCEVYSYGWGYTPIVTTSTSSTTSTTLQSLNLPDLVVTDVSFSPAYPQAGQRVDFTIKVKNIGAGDAGNHYLEVYLLGQLIYRVSGILKASQTDEIKFSWTCPNYAFDSDLKVVVDPANQITESNEGNNQLIKYFTCGAVPPSGKPDLIIEKVTFEPGPIAGPGTPIGNLRVYVKNIGEQPVNDSFYIAVNIDGTFILNWLVTEKIPVNELKIISSPSTSVWICPISGGQHMMQVYADYYNGQQNINESNENNNVFTTSIDCGAASTQKPDLTIYAVQVDPVTPYVGDKVNITITEKNIGTADLNSTHFIALNLKSAPSGIAVGNIGVKSVTNVKKGETASVIFNWTCPSQSGSYVFEAEADAFYPQDNVSESNENNNKSVFTIGCASQPVTQKPDLVITTIQITPSNPKAGDYVNYVITEKNQGSTTAGRHYIGWYQNDSLMGASLVYGLAPGATTEYSFALQYMQAGSYSIKAKADLYNEIDESNETNNIANSSLIIGEGYIYHTQTGCVKSPAYNGDLCSGYRLITSLNYSSACYRLDQCLAVQGDGTCVKSPVYQGDPCSGYRLMPGIKRACYSYSECLNALNQSSYLDSVESILAQISDIVSKLTAAIGLLGRGI